MGTMTRATPSMILRVSSDEEALKAVRVAVGSMDEMSMRGNMPMTPKKVTPMMYTALHIQAFHSWPRRSMQRTPSRPARATTGSRSSSGLLQ